MTADHNATERLQLLQRLQDTYAARTDEDSLRRSAELTLALGAWRDLDNRRQYPDRPLQIALLGPTQVGKSTVTNLLLATAAAEVSPLAGFTIHPQGFQTGGQDARWADELFEGWQRVTQDELQRDTVEQFVLGYQPGATPPTAGDVVVWDTPDFDSLRAQQYIGSVFRVAALADVVVLVLSREKYSDLTVWETLQLLAPLERPMVVCLNKTDAAVQGELSQALRQRLQEFTPQQAEAPIVPLPLDPNLLNSGSDQVEHLRTAVGRAAVASPSEARQTGLEQLLRSRGPDWFGPVEAEQVARTSWEEDLQEALQEAEATYRRDYLEHPQRFDTFQRAIGELLTLLEVPGVAGTLTQIRQVLTWPARQLFAGRTWWQKGSNPHSAGSEELVLRDVIDRFFLHTQRSIARRLGQRTAQTWWQSMHAALDGHESELRSGLDQAIEAYRKKFEQEIHQTARTLYAALQDRPTLLNTLRAARTTADAASIALAVKTAGLGVDALLLAPAMVGVTSMLTEGALGTYMQTVAQKLREKQLEALRDEVLQPALALPLGGMPLELEDATLFRLKDDEYAQLRTLLSAGAPS